MDLAILAGGKSGRFGSRKDALPFGKSTLLEWIVNRLRGVSGDIIVVRKGETGIPSIEGIRIVEDTSEEGGALIGIRTALLASREEYCFVFACDMPFLSLDLVERMMSMERGHDALVPMHSKGIEPLHTVYSKSCINAIDECIRLGEKSVRSVLSMVRTEYVMADMFCNPEIAFFNINTRADYERAIDFGFSRKEEELCH